MKSFCLTSITLIFTSSLITNAQEIKVGDTVIIENTRITKIEGQTKYGYTQVTFIKPNYVLGQINEQAEKEMWTAKEKSEQIANAKTYKKGGELQIEIGRLTIDAANTKWFTVIFKKNNVEIFRKQLKDRIASTPSSNDLWWNVAIVSIPKPIAPPFDIYVVESGAERLHYQVLP